MLLPGAMLPKEWEKPGVLKEWSMASFDLHMKLAKEFPECGYRRIDACSVALKEGLKCIYNTLNY